MKAKHVLSHGILAAGIVAAFAGVPAGAASTEPARAIYGSYEYVESATGSDCVVTTGEYFSGRLTWPGAGKSGAVWRYQLNGPSGPEVKENSYPKTPVAGVKSWSGTVNTVIEPSGTTGTSTLDATITYINSSAFVLTRTDRYENCTEVIFSSLVHD
jgi:hypothetical protein